MNLFNFKHNYVLFYLIIFLFGLAISYLNYSLKLSGDEISYYKLAVSNDVDILEKNWHLPGFHFFLKTLSVFSIIEFYYFRIFITIINFSLIILIAFLLGKYFKVNKFLFTFLLFISPTFTFYLVSSLWADIFSSLVFSLALIFLFIYLTKLKKNHFLYFCIFLFAFSTLLRPQYTLFILLIGFILFIKIISSNNIRKKLKKSIVLIIANFFIFLPILVVTLINYFSYDIFFPFISPALVKLFHFPTLSFIDTIESQFDSFNLYGIHLFIENYSLENNLTFGESARHLNKIYTLDISYVDWVLSNSFEAFKIYFWTAKQVFIDRYIQFICWGEAVRFQRDNKNLLYLLEAFARIIYLLMLLYTIISIFFQKNNVPKYIITMMVLIIVSYVYLLCFNGIGLPHGRHFFEFQALIIIFFCILMPHKD